MENKDRYLLFKDIYMELLRAELNQKLSQSFNSILEINMELLNNATFSRAYVLTAALISDVEKSHIISKKGISND